MIYPPHQRMNIDERRHSASDPDGIVQAMYPSPPDPVGRWLMSHMDAMLGRLDDWRESRRVRSGGARARDCEPETRPAYGMK